MNERPDPLATVLIICSKDHQHIFPAFPSPDLFFFRPFLFFFLFLLRFHGLCETGDKLWAQSSRTQAPAL